jgi:hypothetical protein
MTNSTYLQRLIARMGMPSLDAAPPFTSPLAPPEAPTPPVYDPFAEVEMSDAVSDAVSVPPGTVEPQATDMPHRQLFPSFRERGGPLPPPERETVIETISPPPERIEVEPLPEVEALERGAAIPFPQPLPELEERSAPLPLQAETAERVVYETIELQVADVDHPQLLPELEAGDKLPPPVETARQVIYESIELPGVETPPSPMQPPIEPDAPTPAPILATPVSQITIGDIVVEIVTQAAMPGRVPSMPASRAARPLEAPAPRVGVRSKRGFGLGQV